jgi:uncharacterized protein involved in exopolysaccharide biosynthesis
MGKTNKGDAMRYEIDIFHYLNIYKKEWKKMAALILLTMLITMIVTLLQPIMYRSTISVLSPKEGGGMGNLGSYLGLSAGPSSDDIIFSMLKSRRMSNDINEHFNLKNKRKFWWEIDTYIVTGGFAVEVKGSDPELTRDIANFSIANLDKINSELQITTQKPMVKVLDPALRGAPVAKKVSNRVAASGLFTLLLHAFFLFFKDYFSQLKKASR